MLRPGIGAGKAPFLAAVQRPTPISRKKSLNSAIYPEKSRLEPGGNLGQKGALPVPGNMVSQLKGCRPQKGQPAKAFSL